MLRDRETDAHTRQQAISIQERIDGGDVKKT